MAFTSAAAVQLARVCGAHPNSTKVSNPRARLVSRETSEGGARTRSRAIAAEPVRSQGVDQQDEEVRRARARSLPLARRPADDPDMAPARSTAGGKGGVGGRRAQLHVHLALALRPK